MTENLGAAFSGQNSKRWTLRVAQVSLLVGLSGMAAVPAQAASSDNSGTPTSGDQTAQASPAPAPASSTPEQEITVTAQRLNEARQNIQPAIGASVYNFSQQTIESLPQ